MTQRPYKTIEDIIEYMKENKVNPLVIDAWDECSTRYPIYGLMEKLYKDKETREVIFNNFKIKIEHTKGGGFGMRAYPAEYRTTILLNFGA
jgi:hypothetical protein